MKKKLTLTIAVFFLAILVSSLSWAGSSDPGNASNANAYQYQGMGQSQYIYNLSGGEEGEIPRNFPYGIQANYPPIANQWGGIRTDGSFDFLSSIVGFQPVWTMADAKRYADQKGKIKITAPKIRPGTIPSRALAFIIQKPQNPEEMARFNSRYVFVDVVTFSSDGAVTSKLFGAAVEEGLNRGATIALYGEGYNYKLEAQSLGINIQGTLSVVNGGAGTGIGGVSGGGTGWVKAWSKYVTNPWLRVYYFKEVIGSPMLPAPAAPLPPKLPQKEDRG